MPRPRLSMVGIAPGISALRSTLDEFCRKGGLVSATSDRRLRPLRTLLGSAADVEVLPFGELVGKMSSYVGVAPRPMVQHGHCIAAISEACAQLNEDSTFYKSGLFAGTHRRLKSCYDELRAWQISPDALDVAAEGIGGPVEAKLHDLAAIFRESEAIVESLARDANADRMESCIQATQSAEGPLPRILIHVGAEFEPLTAKWIAWCAQAGAHLTVVCEANPTGGSAFNAASLYARHFKSNLEIKGECNDLARGLLGAPGGSRAIESVIVDAPDPLAEAEWTLRSCLEDLASDRTCSIIARDLETYAPLVEAAGKRLGIPVQTARRVPLLTNGFAKLILDCIETCASKDVAGFGHLARRTYFETPPELAELLNQELLAAMAKATGQWDHLRMWAELVRDEAPWLALLLDWREEAMSENHTLAGWVGLVRDLGILPWSWDSAVRTSERDEHAQTALQRMLAQVASIERVRGSRTYDLKQFAARCRILCEDADTSIPAPNFGIRLVSSAEELGETDSLYVLGMLEGSFPKRRSEDPILTDLDREIITKALNLDVPLPSSHDKAAGEREEFIRVCASAGSKLTLSYPQVGDDRDNVPAFYLTEMAGLSTSARISHRRSQPTPALYACATEADRRLATAFLEAHDNPEPPTLQTEQAISIVRGNVPRSYGQRELELAAECPFRAWALRTKLKPYGRESRWNLLLGLPERAGLSCAPTETIAAAALEAELERLVDSLAGIADPHELTLLRSGGRRLIQGWVRREFLARECWPRDGTIPTVRFGDPEIRSEIMGVSLEGRFGPMSRIRDARTVHLFVPGDAFVAGRSGNHTVGVEDLSERYRFDVALAFAAMGVGARAVEVDSATGQRTLFMLRQTDNPYPSMTAENLRFVYLAPESVAPLRDILRSSLRQAKEALESGSIEARPGENCEFCPYGELCRWHQDYGETSDPFVSAQREA